VSKILILKEQEQMEPNSPDFPETEEPLVLEGELNPVSHGYAATEIQRLGLWVRDLLVSAAASVLIITFLYQPVRVEGTSMLPRLEDQDRLFINKFVYHFTSIERGDVVVFHYPRDPEKSYIKRVIALPGDRLRITQGTVLAQWRGDQRELRSRGVQGQPLVCGDCGSRGHVLHDGRPPVNLLRQPGIRPRGALADLRQGGFCLLAGAGCGRGAVERGDNAR
jgi:signal peptidase I